MQNTEPWRNLTLKDVRELNPALFWSSTSTRTWTKFSEQMAQLDEGVRADLEARAVIFVEEQKKMREQRKEALQMKKMLEKKRRMEASIFDRHEKFERLASMDDFLVDVGDDVRKNVLEKFIDATSMNKVKQVVCSTCAGTFDVVDTKEMDMRSIPNSHLLRPDTAHKDHNLCEGMLLEKSGLVLKDHSWHAVVCHRCLQELEGGASPRLSLANNMWIGDVPFQLQVLTVPERLLISIYYPAVYVYKLYPKAGRMGGSRFVSEGLRGNVSTYRLAPHRMAELAQGTLLPRKPEILASLISISMVGRNRFPERTLKGVFRLRRSRVLAALLWLKENNPFYHNLSIDEDALTCIPEDDIPESIADNIRIITDEAEVEKEKESYVPDVDALSHEGVEDPCDPENGHEYSDVADSEQHTGGDEVEPDIIPLNETLVVDVDGTDVHPEELFYHGVSNALGNEKGEPPYHYQRGTGYVNEYPRRDQDGNKFEGSEDNPNHLLGAFPYLFPYGVGGFETARKKTVSYAEHAAWALRYHDGRFAKNMTFISQVFNVLQKREVCRSANLQVSKRDFAKYEHLFKQISVKDLLSAAEMESKGVLVTDRKIKKLRQLITATRRSVRGTDENRQRLRSRIYGMTMMKGPPSLWMTLNFSDTKDPLVQIFAGEDLDMDNLKNGSGPSAEDMSKNTAENPVAATKAFFLMMKYFFEILLGIKVMSLGQLKREMGIFGITEAYMGSIEAQGRGSLHAHLFIWLHGSPTGKQMQTMLQDPTFRRRMEEFISTNIHSHVEGLDESYLRTETAKELRDLKSIATAFSRPLDPRKEHFDELVKKFEFASARVNHLHVCSASTCLLPDKKKGMKCKRRAPWKLATHTRVHENGEWESARHLKWLNTWCLIIMLVFRSNHDIKMLINAGITKDIIYYTIKYFSKPQARSNNFSAVMAPEYTRNQQGMAKASSLRDANKKMLSQCVNTLSRYQEFSAQQIVALIMGWGDRFESHTFTPIYLRSLMSKLLEQFPELEKNSVYQVNQNSRQSAEYELDKDAEMVSLSASSTNDKMEMKSQVQDYMNRGKALETFSFLMFLLETYEPKNKAQNDAKVRHVRIPYLENLELYNGRVRVLRNERAEMMPDFLGSWPPRNDVPDARDMYCCTMLALLKPWRDWKDLKGTFETWAEAFSAFEEKCCQRSKNIMDNVQFYYESQDTASTNRNASAVETEGEVENQMVEPEDGDDEAVDALGTDPSPFFTEPIESPRKIKERLFGEVAIDIATRKGVFGNDKESTVTPPSCSATRATDTLINAMTGWRNTMHEVARSPEEEDHDPTEGVDIAVVVEDNNTTAKEALITVDVAHGDKEVEVESLLERLNDNQRKAFDIVNHHLSRHLQGGQEQLLMLLMGAGGVGKSVVIRAIEDLFRLRGASKLLSKTGTTGVAASHIGGCTVHFWAGLSIYNPPSNGSLPSTGAAMSKRRKNNMEHTRYLIIDEVSMLTMSNLGLMSRLIADIHDPTGNNRGLPFGGKLNVILVGDFHQFPPPGLENYALFRQRAPPNHTWAKIGQNVFSSFTTAVVLKQQMRSVDPTWSGILERVRHCESTMDDIEALRMLTLTDPRCNIPDFSSPPWNSAVLITTRHTVRDAWNNAMLRKIAREERKTILVCPCVEYVGKTKKILTQEEKDTSKLYDGWELPYSLELFEGMRVFITTNISVKSHLANGTLGTLEKIFLDPREPAIATGTYEHHLHFPPILLLFRPDLRTSTQFDNLAEGILPVEIFKSAHDFQLKDGRKIRINRLQFAVTPAYAFTDYKSQGQTVSPVIVDLAKPPSGRMTPFNAYVALSRSTSRENLRLLRDFDVKLFTQPMDEDLYKFHLLLQKLDAET